MQITALTKRDISAVSLNLHLHVRKLLKDRFLWKWSLHEADLFIVELGAGPCFSGFVCVFREDKGAEGKYVVACTRADMEKTSGSFILCVLNIQVILVFIHQPCFFCYTGICVQYHMLTLYLGSGAYLMGSVENPAILCAINHHVKMVHYILTYTHKKDNWQNILNCLRRKV